MVEMEQHEIPESEPCLEMALYLDVALHNGQFEVRYSLKNVWPVAFEEMGGILDA